MTSTQDTFVMSTSGEMMEVLDRFRLDQKVETVKEDPVQRQILRIILKYEMQSLLQRLAEIGEESVVVTANVVDGTHSVLASDQGEKFLHNGVVTTFMDHFVRYLYTGETPNTVSESSSDAYIIKYGISRQENNLSRSSVSSSEEPETFMHMKKHQIEQFNRKKDHEDRAIDETVSRLVKNILREGKEKERQSVTSTNNSVVGSAKRKRVCSYRSYNNNAGSIDVETCSLAKKKQIVEFYPHLSPVLVGDGSNSSQVSLKNDDKTSQTEDDVITIKIEPDGDEGYGGALAETSEKCDSDGMPHEKGLGVLSCSDNSSKDMTNKKSIVSGESSDSGKLKKSNETIIAQNNNKNVNSCDNSRDVLSPETLAETSCQTSKTVKVKVEEDVDLPFVEEYYQNRGKCLEDVKLTPEEIGTDSASKTNVSCYKQSRKKSNTFNLVLNGYLYIKDKQGSTGTVYWKCGRVGCKGRVIQRGQELIISQTHIHGPSHRLEGNVDGAAFQGHISNTQNDSSLEVKNRKKLEKQPPKMTKLLPVFRSKIGIKCVKG